MKRFNLRKFLLEAASIVIACLMIAAGFVWWRLVHGQAEVNFLRPVIEAAFFQETGMHLQLDRLTFGAKGWRSPVEIGTEGVAVTDKSGTKALTVDAAEGTLSYSALLTGRFKPINVTLTKPQLIVTREADGSFHPRFLYGKSGSTGQLGLDFAPVASPKRDSGLSAWNNVALHDGALILNDALGQEIARADALNATFRRTPLGLEGSLRGATKVGRQTGEITGAIDCNTGAKGAILLQVSSFRPDALLVVEPLLAKIQAPTSLRLTGQLNGTNLESAQLDLSLQAGQLVDPAHYSKPVPIAGGVLQAVYQALPERLELRKLELGLGGPLVSVTGQAHTEGGMVSLESDITVADMPLDSFDKFWPQDVSKGGRAWVTANLSKGIVSRATSHLTGSGPRASLGQIDVTGFKGTIEVVGAAIHYFGELPAVEDASASIVYDRNSMIITMLGGHAEDTRIAGGTVTLNGFSSRDQDIRINLDMTGPVASSLDILAHKPLGYARKLQLDPKTVSGDAAVNMQIGFPLLSALKVDQIALGVKATLLGVSIPNAVGKTAVSDLNGGLSVDTGGLEYIGTGKLGDAPLSADYKQSFAADGATDVTFDGKVNDVQRARLGVDFPDRLKGTAGISGHYASASGMGTADLAIDLMSSELIIDEIGYDKPVGQPGTGRFKLMLDKGKLVAIDPLSIDAPALSVAGAARLDPDTGAVVSVRLDRFTMDKTDMKVAVAQLEGGGSRIDISGAEFDARRFLHKRRQKGAEKAARDESDEKPVPLQINVALDRVKTADDAGLTDLKGQLILLGRKWQRADFTADTGGSGLSLSYLPDSDQPNPSYTLRADATNAGAAFAGFALTSSINGGLLAIDGRKPAASDAQPDPALEGTLRLSDFSVTDPPVFARLFNLLSLRGFKQSLSSPDIQFDYLQGGFSISGSNLSVSDGKLAGAAIGLTIAGTVDRDADTLNLSGTVVPAYGANRILRRVPVLGPLITGEDGEGVFAATYTITGSVASPDVAVDPLSIFAPGVLRDLLFSRSDPDHSGVDPRAK